ncbi:unnamed protein product [Rhodiola kirilowii]
MWKSCIESYLVGEELWEVVGGANARPEDGDADAQDLWKWKMINAKAEFVLKKSISPTLFEHIFRCTSTNEIWETLNRLFNKKDVGWLQALENELANTTQGDLSISQFYLKVKNLCSEISRLDPDEPISEARVRRHIILGLMKEYTPFVTSIQGWDRQPSLEEFENLLSSQESLARQMVGMSISSDSNNVGEALSTHRKKNFRFEKKFKKHDDKPSESSSHYKKRFKCHRCRKLGHIKRFCTVKLNARNYANKNGGSHVPSAGEDEENWGKCFMVESTTLDALTSINFKDDWIVDSGCGHHLTGDESKFAKIQPHVGNETMVTADNTVHKVENEGTVIIKDGVPNFVDDGYYVIFGPRDVKFLRNVEYIKGDVMHTGRRVKDTFVLSASSSYIDKVSCNENASLWHARLGHLSFDKLKVMVRDNLVNGLPSLTNFPSKEVCKGCQFGKSRRLPFKISQSRTKTPLEFILGDLFGPTQTPSLSGFHYLMILVDDFSRYTWVYCIKDKSDAFLTFKENVEGVLGLRIKKFQIKKFHTDNGGEFTSRIFFNFCRQSGIRRELSCSCTPQQNGIAERKIRHLTETCRSWLHAKKFPKSLWAEGMICAAYVINRLPLSPNNMRTPYELMFGEKPSVKHFKVFGSLCYVHVPDSTRRKFDAKVKKCIFIGYDERKKGWKCMDPETHTFAVSRDVVFDEVSSYYSTNVTEESSLRESDIIVSKWFGFTVI